MEKLPDTAYWPDREDPLALVHGRDKWERQQAEIMALCLLAAMPSIKNDPMLVAAKVARLEKAVGSREETKELLRRVHSLVVQWTAPESV